MRLSWNEVGARAAAFAEDWKDAAYEKDETLALHILAGGQNSEIGDGFHGSVHGKRFLSLYLTPVP